MRKLLLKVAISCVLLGLLLWRVPLGEIGTHLRSFGPTTLLLVLVVSLACWVVAAVRQWCLLPEYRYRDLLLLTFIARFYATVLPGQIAGDVVKAYRLGRQSSRTGHAEAATLLDRGLGLFALFLISAIASLYSARVPLLLRLFFIFGTMAIVAGGVIASSRLFRTEIVERLLSRRKGRVSAFARDFSIAFHDHLRRPMMLVAAVVLGLVFHAGCVAMQVLLGNDLGMRLSWADWTVVYAGVSLLMLLPISVAGLGLREGGYVGLLALFGYKASTALSLSFAMFGISLVATLVGGALELATVMTRARATRSAADRPTER
jgi:uncharacterized protein (TIRG00374 family)